MSDKPDLSIIVPFVQEFPQVAFTLRSIATSLEGRLDFEIWAVDNWCAEVAEQGRSPDDGHDHLDKDGNLVDGAIKSWARHRPWLQYLAYDEQLSHWQCKRRACEAARADTLLFLDSHVVPSRDAIVRQFEAYQGLRDVGTLHLPLTYHILESHRLIYKLVDDRATGNIAYSFTGYRDEAAPYEVPCMSTCGMMMSREIYDRLGGWPEALTGSYGGGEHWVNFTCAVLGIKKLIMPGVTLHHHGAKRGYGWRWGTYQRNRGVANYIFGGEKYLRLYIDHKYRGKRDLAEAVIQDVMAACAAHRDHVVRNQAEDIDEWCDRQSSTIS